MPLKKKNIDDRQGKAKAGVPGSCRVPFKVLTDLLTLLLEAISTFIELAQKGTLVGAELTLFKLGGR